MPFLWDEPRRIHGGGAYRVAEPVNGGHVLLFLLLCAAVCWAVSERMVNNERTYNERWRDAQRRRRTQDDLNRANREKWGKP